MYSKTIDLKIIIALTLYLVSLLAANTLGLKIMPFVSGTHLSVAVFFFPFVFLTTDVIGQVYGKSMAKNFVYAGFIAVSLFMFYSLISLVLPWSADGLKLQDSFNVIFGLSFRLSAASLIAFFIAQYQDVISFFFFKKKFGDNDKVFWLKSNLSNLWSQFWDTAIFMLVAYVGVYPLKTIIMIALPWWLFKVAMGLLYTPLSYLGLYLLRFKKNNNDYESNND